MTTWFLLVATLVSPALANRYNFENAFNLSTKQPLFHQLQNTSPQGIHGQDNPLTPSIAIKDYVYAKQNDGTEALSRYKSKNSKKNVSNESYSISRYSKALSLGYRKSFTQSFILPGSNAQVHHRATTLANVSDQNQASRLHANVVNIQKLVIPSDSINYNGFISALSTPYNRFNTLGKNEDVQTTPASGIYNNVFAQDRTLQVSGPVSSDYKQFPNVNAPFKNRYMDFSKIFAGTNQNIDKTRRYLPEIEIMDLNTNNEYTQPVPSSAMNTFTKVFGEMARSLRNTNLNNENKHIGTLRGGASLGPDISLFNTSSGGNGNNVYASSAANESLNNISSTSQQQDYRGPFYDDLRGKIMRAFPTGSTSRDGDQNFLTLGGNSMISGFPNVLNDKKFKSIIQQTTENLPDKEWSPIVHKHIYLHVSPLLKESYKVIPPSKKSYNILYIKVPPQESNPRMEKEVIHRKDASVDDKTLIYVLMKNLENPNPIVLPKPKPTAHQVFFVKYNDQQDLASQVDNELDKSESRENYISLGPDLLNELQN